MVKNRLLNYIFKQQILIISLIILLVICIIYRKSIYNYLFKINIEGNRARRRRRRKRKERQERARQRNDVYNNYISNIESQPWFTQLPIGIQYPLSKNEKYKPSKSVSSLHNIIGNCNDGGTNKHESKCEGDIFNTLNVKTSSRYSNEHKSNIKESHLQNINMSYEEHIQYAIKKDAEDAFKLKRNKSNFYKLIKETYERVKKNHPVISVYFDEFMTEGMLKYYKNIFYNNNYICDNNFTSFIYNNKESNAALKIYNHIISKLNNINYMKEYNKRKEFIENEDIESPGLISNFTIMNNKKEGLWIRGRDKLDDKNLYKSFKNEINSNFGEDLKKISSNIYDTYKKDGLQYKQSDNKGFVSRYQQQYNDYVISLEDEYESTESEQKYIRNAMFASV